MSDEKVEMTGTFGSNPKFFAREIIDRKGNAVDPGECIIFKVTDEDLWDVLKFYRNIAWDKQHKSEVQKLMEELETWQDANKDRVKAAD